MIDEQTLEKLRTMRLHAMADFVQTVLLKGPGSDLSNAEQIGMMVDQEWTARENRRMSLLLKNAKIPASPCGLTQLIPSPTGYTEHARNHTGLRHSAP